MSVAAPRRSVAAPRAVPAIAVRVVTLVALALYAGIHWGAMVIPSRGGRMVLVLAAALVAAFALRRIALLAPRGTRIAARAVVGVALVVVVLLAAGVPARLLVPDEWGTLATNVADGISTLPAIRVPYRGAEEWVRIVILGGGGLLLAAAVPLALARRPRVTAAAVLLTILYAIPVIQHNPDHPVLDGTVFAVLLAGLLWGERLRRTEALLAGGVVLVAVLLGALIAPRLDSGRPWISLQDIARDLEDGRTTAFSWNHSYQPLGWPRDGRELLRVSSRREAYWKTAALEDFDGLVWRTPTRYDPDAPDSELADNPLWRQDLEVTVRGLRSADFITAGSALSIIDATRRVERGTPGTFITGARPLTRGDTYKASVYVPRPSRRQLNQAGTDYPDFVLRRGLTMELPAATGTRGTRLSFPAWGAASNVIAAFGGGFTLIDGTQAIAASPYGRVYDLAQRLRAASSDPADFVRRVQARVQDGAVYSESPTVRRDGVPPLVHFLFDDRQGYCQHFSGAMALLLRMGGVPARVASGFSPGSRDQDSGDFIVRDLDAHSWVEAYFPKIGWVTFDPTPAASPARSQIADRQTTSGISLSGLPTLPATGDRTGADPLGAGVQAQAADEGSSALVPVLAAVGGAVALLAAALLLVGHRRRRGRRRGEPREVTEVRRALAHAGRPLPPTLTLAEAAELLRREPEARDYLTAIGARRYGTGGPPPTRAGRRALRRALSDGRDLRGRLAVLRALPPATLVRVLEGRRERPYTG